LTRRTRYEELVFLGRLSLIPFAVGVAGVWILPHALAIDVHRIVLAYGAIVAAYLAGIGAGGILVSKSGSTESLTASVVTVFVAWSALWLAMGSFFHVAPVWRYFLIIGVWIFLLLRDSRAIERRQLPSAYGPLRAQMTFWAVLAMALIAARLALWGQY